MSQTGSSYEMLVLVNTCSFIHISQTKQIRTRHINIIPETKRADSTKQEANTEVLIQFRFQNFKYVASCSMHII